MRRRLRDWKPIPLCWLYRRMGWRIPRYLIGHDLFTPAQSHFRFYSDGTESGSTALAVEDTNISLAVNGPGDSTVHLRVLINATNTAPGLATDDYQLQVNKNSTSYADITGSSVNVKGFDSTNLTEGQATTNRAGGLTDIGTFAAGKVSEDGLVDDVLLNGSGCTELLYSLALPFADVASGDTLDFRVLVNGGTMIYNVTPRITITQTNPTISSASMADADRNWDTPYQDITVTFDQAVDITPTPNLGDTIAGLTAQVNGGANAALTYVSGNATATWKVRRAELIQQDDTVVLDYDMTTGDILAVDDDAELKTETDQAVTNNLTKRVRFTLKKADDTVVASETVKYSVHQFDSGAPANANWMARELKGTTTTDASGTVDVDYSAGTAAVGGTVYVVVIRPDTTPTESMVWTDLVQ
jgi:hypothetical protein